MAAIAKMIEAFVLDVNKENSKILSLFEGLTKILFKGVIILGVPLIIYMLTQLHQGI